MAYQDIVIELLRQYPEASMILGAFLGRVALAWQSQLSWSEYRSLHGIKRLLARYAGVFVHRKGGRDDAEYLTTWQGTPRAAANQLSEAGGSLHLIAAVKQRPATHGDPYSMAHIVWTHADGTQTEVYIFENDDGTADVYVHSETSVTDPVGHLTDTQRDGDGRGIVRDALDLESEPTSDSDV
jgi:hypothetical protein